MNTLVLVVGILSYLTMAVVVRRHFSAMTWPREAMVTRIISDVGMIAFVWLMWRERHPLTSLAISLLLFVACLALLLWTARTTAASQLRVAFDPTLPGGVIRTGPYRLIRHPFYTSYVLFWLACAVATLHPISGVFLIAIAAINVVAARREERSFVSTTFAAQYEDYRRTTGMFWPRLDARTGRR